jgi:hypothetical protein
MSQEDVPKSPANPAPIGSTERSAAMARAVRVDSWQATKKSFAFALAADDYKTGWLDRLTKSANRIRELTEQDPDVALYMMLQTATNDADNYSASHAMFCAVVSDLCTAYFEWPEVEATAVRNAALTMNIGMLLMQDSMAQQIESPSPAQRLHVADHPARGVELLKGAGVDDPLWLETVRRHHRPVDEGESSDPLNPPQRLAQLLQRIDVFTAKLSKRKTRPGSTATVAARDACLDTSGLPDATGATMLRVLGLYPPGTFVRLTSGEIGVVIRRGDKAHTPVVACVRRGDGGVISQPMMRDTSNRLHAVQRSLSADEVKIRLDHERVVGARR